MPIPITPTISFDPGEIEESFIRSSGPGGQNVNKVSTAVQVRLDLRPRGLACEVAAVPGLIRGVVRAELRRFKEYIEGMGQAGGSWRETIRGGHVHARQAEPPRSRVAGWPVG